MLKEIFKYIYEHFVRKYDNSLTAEKRILARLFFTIIVVTAILFSGGYLMSRITLIVKREGFSIDNDILMIYILLTFICFSLFRISLRQLKFYENFDSYIGILAPRSIRGAEHFVLSLSFSVKFFLRSLFSAALVFLAVHLSFAIGSTDYWIAIFAGPVPIVTYALIVMARVFSGQFAYNSTELRQLIEFMMERARDDDGPTGSEKILLDPDEAIKKSSGSEAGGLAPNPGRT